VSFGFNPFEERERPPMSAEMFATLVVARLRGVVGIVVQERHGLEFKLRVDEQARVAHLDSYYRRYRAEPNALTPLIWQFIDDLRAGVPEPPAPESFGQIAPRLMPLLISSAEWSQKREQGIRLVVRPLVQDLGIALVIDEPTAIRYVELEAIPRWEIDVALAYDAALDNLERRAQGVQVAQIGVGAEMLLIDRAADGYAATRAFLPSRQQDWSRRVPGELLLGLPTRDFLIGFSREHPNVEALQAQVAEDAQNQDHGLIPQLLVYRDGTLEILDVKGESM
jgi:hypothetical protein